ncbi:MAG: F0F1 ATP synthase subunit A [SAR324 cluster bacterium]|nr:F0F1 ATP synthase subunit A [SAR324 cluster bacterium]MBL7034367.1 F0F1 ATP synthase subunit A [SAR324 cluster bacterium]
MNKRFALIIVLLLTATPVFASAAGFTWAHFLFGGLEQPLVELGIDPVPILDLLIVAFFLIAAAFFAGKPFRKTDMLEPSGHANLANFAEVVVSAILNFLSGTIRHGVGARPILPLLGTYGLFILMLNLAGLVPGFNPPTDQFNVTIAFALIIFIMTHVLGIRQHGASYIKQFLGPMPLLAPLMLPIEIVSHCVRPLSLSIRLFGNMTGDHKVVLIFTSILAVGLPIPFMGLGILVSVLQAFVFVLLSAIYFELAMSEAH